MRRSARPWRAWISIAKVVPIVVVAGLVALVAPTARILLQGRPIDTTVAHGDDCLAQRQGQDFRCWDVFVPENLPAGPVPLLVDLHGFLNSPEVQRGFSRFDDLAVEDGFVVAWPYGIDRSWNGGGDRWSSDIDFDERPGIGCCGHALNEQIDDVGFILAMIEQLQSDHEIDDERVFLSGFSNGCILAQRVAAEASASIDGVACMAGHLLATPADDYEPIPIMEIHGTADPVTEYDAGHWPGSIANFEAWADRNGCDQEPTEIWRDGPHVALQAGGCQNDANVALVTLEGFGHLVYQGEGWLHVDTSRLAWDFLIGAAG